jgi:hypothetical protein
VLVFFIFSPLASRVGRSSQNTKKGLWANMDARGGSFYICSTIAPASQTNEKKIFADRHQTAEFLTPDLAAAATLPGPAFGDRPGCVKHTCSTSQGLSRHRNLSNFTAASLHIRPWAKTRVPYTFSSA